MEGSGFRGFRAWCLRVVLPLLLVTCVEVNMVVSINRGTPNTIVLIIGTPTMVPLI